jgi:thymidylate synthase (FAD)
MLTAYEDAFGAYEEMLQAGIAKEVARMVLPVGIFTSYFATCNARSLMHFLSLRTISAGSTFPSFPQREIEMVAEQMEEVFKVHMPITHEAFVRNGRVAP